MIEQRRTPAPAKSGLAATIVILLALGLAGVGGWWFLTHRTNPREQAEKFITATKAMDWKTLYALTDFSAEQKAQYPNAQAFEESVQQQLRKAPGAEGMLRSLMSSIENIKAGEPTYNGSEATVPLAFSMTMFGNKMDMNEKIQMKNIGGIWKVVPGKTTLGGAGLPGQIGGFGGMGR